MKRQADDAHLDAALNPALLEVEASEHNTLLQEGGGEESEEADAAAAAAARPPTATTPANVHVARRVVARWRAFVAERKVVLLLRLLRELPDLFVEEVLRRLDPVDRTMLAQVGRPWLAAVLASGLPRLPSAVRVCLQLRELCTSAERLAWARANGCPWGAPLIIGDRRMEWYPCALAAAGGHLDALQWARAQGCEWDGAKCAGAAAGGHLDVLQWARAHGCPWIEDFWMNRFDCCRLAAKGGHLEVLRWLREHNCTWDKWTCAVPLRAGIWRCCSGHISTAARGTGLTRVALSPLRAVNWTCSSGCGRTVAHLTRVPVQMVPGTNPRLWHGCSSSHKTEE